MLQKLVMRPGVNREGTSYSNEGGYYEGDKVRFRSGFPEKIGGWARLGANTFVGVVRTLWNWVTLAGYNLTTVGTNLKYFIESGGTYNDITPWAVDSVGVAKAATALGNNPFSMVSGSPYVTVTAAAHGATGGTYVTFAGATAAGGLTIVGEFQIIATPDSNSYAIIAASNASSTTTGGGAGATARYKLSAGLVTYTTGNGWGAGGWERGGWGSAATVGIGQQLTLWTQDNFGQNLVFAQRGGPLWYWVVDTAYPQAVSLQSTANTTTKLNATSGATLAGVSFGSGSSSITVTADLIPYLSPGCVLSGTGLAAAQYVTTAWDFSTTVPISAVTTAVSSGAYTISYAGRFIPTQTNRVVASNIQRFVICMGANSYNPVDFATSFDPMLVRWADQENVFEWVPATSNQAGEQKLSNGSVIVTAVSTRQEIVIWSDSAVYSMQYVGAPYIWGFQLLMDSISIISPNAAHSANNITYWMGKDKFYTYSGRVETLPCTLRQFVFGDINLAQSYQIVAGSNEGFNEVWWHYPSANSMVNNTYVIFNHLERIWYYGSLNRTAWLDSALKDSPMAAFSYQQSYLNSAISSSDTSFALLNAASYPASGSVIIESENILYTGVSGNTLTGCTRGANGTTAASHDAYLGAAYANTAGTVATNTILLHESGIDDGSTAVPAAITSFIQSSDFDIGDGHNYGFVWRVIPDINFDQSTASQPVITLTVKPRTAPGAAYGSAQSPTVTRTQSVPVELYTQQVYTRLRGRQMAFRIDSNSLGVQWQLGAPRIDIRPDGRKS